MIKKFIRLRFYQVQRSLQSLGIFHIVVLALLIFFGSLSVLANIRKNDETLGMVFIIGLALLYTQVKRSDKRFTAIIFNQPHHIFIAEYSLLTTPIWLYLFWLKNIASIILFIISIISISFINKELSQYKGTSFFSKLLPKSAFEWKGGMRKWGLQIAIFYTLAAGLSWIRVAPFLFLFLALSTISQFFTECEPLSILSLSQDKTKPFLRKKIQQSLIIYGIITLPIIIVSMVLVPDLWFLGVAFYILACFNIANFILGKYAYYRPNENVGAGNMINQMCLFGVILPILLPITFILPFWNYFKSKPKLNYYLND